MLNERHGSKLSLKLQLKFSKTGNHINQNINQNILKCEQLLGPLALRPCELCTWDYAGTRGSGTIATSISGTRTTISNSLDVHSATNRQATAREHLLRTMHNHSANRHDYDSQLRPGKISFK